MHQIFGLKDMNRSSLAMVLLVSPLRLKSKAYEGSREAYEVNARSSGLSNEDEGC
jgi:hypothetical protein